VVGLIDKKFHKRNLATKRRWSKVVETADKLQENIAIRYVSTSVHLNLSKSSLHPCPDSSYIW